MRIIAGQFRGLKLKTIDNDHIRPTLDRVKEAVFSMMESQSQRGVFLDLFAGSGAIGIEALSRYYEEVIFVEKEKKHIKIIEENIKALKTSGYQIYHEDAFSLLRGMIHRQKKFDVIYLDPPFKSGLLERILPLILENNLLQDQGIIVIEHGVDDPLPLSFQRYIVKEKKYGKILITILRRESDESLDTRKL